MNCRPPGGGLKILRALMVEMSPALASPGGNCYNDNPYGPPPCVMLTSVVWHTGGFSICNLFRPLGGVFFGASGFQSVAVLFRSCEAQ